MKVKLDENMPHALAGLILSMKTEFGSGQG